jgi:hypothetical protein
MLTDVSEVRTASTIALMVEAVRISETSVNIYLTTRQYIPEDSKLKKSFCLTFIEWIEFSLISGPWSHGFSFA